MHIGFRTDASLKIGTGHVMRCLALADEMAKQGARCTFICRPHQGNLISLVQDHGHKVIPLPNILDETACFGGASIYTSWLGIDWRVDADDTLRALNGVLLDWLVVDHYALDQNWEKVLRIKCNRLMVIDDLADRPHMCDVLLDQNLGRSVSDYKHLVADSTLILAGPENALMRPEFAKSRMKSLSRRGRNDVNNLLITMGGVDKENHCEVVLNSLKLSKLKKQSKIVVVLGSTSPWVERVKSKCEELPWEVELIVGASNMADLMTNADLCIGSAGSTSWERCALGLPSILICTAENQKFVINALNESGAAIICGDNLNITKGLVIESLIHEAELNLVKMASSAAEITDGMGCSRVSNILMAMV